MEILIVGIISYLMGSIPFGLILTKIFLKKDIREIGSGNIGATNALRTGNKIIGYTTLFFDIDGVSVRKETTSLYPFSSSQYLDSCFCLIISFK